MVCEATVPENKISRANKHHFKHRRRSDLHGSCVACVALRCISFINQGNDLTRLEDPMVHLSKTLRLVSMLPHLEYRSETGSEGPDNFDSGNQHRAARRMLNVKCYITSCWVG